MDPNKVIERIKAGSEEELANVYKKYRKEFLNWMGRTYNCSLEDGKDIYQATIITFYESIKAGKLVELKSSLKTYLFAVGKNKLHEQKRYSNKQETLMEKEKEGIYFMDEPSGQDENAFQKVEKCLENLGDPCKSLLKLYYYNKLTIPQITDRLNYKNNDTSKNLKYKCLKRLRKIYETQTENSK